MGHPYEYVFDRSLDAYARCSFNLLLDNGLLYGYDPKHQECISITPTGQCIPIKRCDRMLGVSQSGTLLYEYANARLVRRAGKSGEYIELSAPHAAACVPSCISYGGNIGGLFNLRQESHPAIWNSEGALTTDVTPLGSITACAPDSDAWFIGFLRGLPALWSAGKPQFLEVHPGEIAHLSCVNSQGLVGGDVFGHPALWQKDGRRVIFGQESQTASVRHLTRDGKLVLECKQGRRLCFKFGPPEALVAIEDLLPPEVAGLYVAKVDALTPSGRMLLTCALDDQSLDNCVQVLLKPKGLT